MDGASCGCATFAGGCDEEATAAIANEPGNVVDGGKASEDSVNGSGCCRCWCCSCSSDCGDGNVSKGDAANGAPADGEAVAAGLAVAAVKVVAKVIVKVIESAADVTVADDGEATAPATGDGAVVAGTTVGAVAVVVVAAAGANDGSQSVVARQ